MVNDDIVNRLRDRETRREFDDWGIMDEAAARIEALTAARDEALNQLDSARHSVDVLAAKLEVADKVRDYDRRQVDHLSTVVDRLNAAAIASADNLDKAPVVTGSGYEIKLTDWLEQEVRIQKVRAEAAEARVKELEGAAREVHADCLMRAKFSRDGKTVPIGASAWITLDNALNKKGPTDG